MPSSVSNILKIPVSARGTSINTNKQYISGYSHGTGQQIVILGNTDSSYQNDWNHFIPEIVKLGYRVITFDYHGYGDKRTNDLSDVISYMNSDSIKDIIVIGASRGGVAAIQIASEENQNSGIIGLVIISAPIFYSGQIFYSAEELACINIPKLIINSEYDGWVDDSYRMYSLFADPKEIEIYPGYAHGIDIISQHFETATNRITKFITTHF